MSDRGYDDNLLDAIAVTEADTRGDEAGVAAITHNCDLAEVTAVLLRLLALIREERAAGGHVCEECWRQWALSAIERA